MKKVLVFGSFDILHPGHLDLFRQAKEYGELLYVVIARDKTIERVKKRKPVYNEKKRMEEVSKLRFVHCAMLGDLEDPYKVIEKVKPDFICLGYDQVNFVDHLWDELKKRDLKADVIRLKPYKAEQYKSSKLREL